MWSSFSLTALLFTYSLAYKAAVVEYYPKNESTPEETIKANLDEYIRYADSAKNQSVDIIVFPEYGLTTVVTNPENYSIEITDDNYVIKNLSAAASGRQLYIVVNVLEKAQNKHSQTEYFNTNLVFSRNGTIILRYRKINLYNETKLTPGDPNQDLTFSTNFGRTFGIFTCFDILFRHPSRTVLDGTEVTDVVFPTAWISKMPFFTSLSVQHGYVLANGVNLLTSNYATPRNGRGGSGIYLADGTIAETYLGDTASSKLIVQTVNQGQRKNTTICPSIVQYGLPGDTTRSNVTNYFTQKAFSASKYQFKNVDLTQSNVTTTVCDRDFCCTFKIILNTTQDSSEVYKVMAFDGTVDFDSTPAHIRTCALVACDYESDHSSCGARINGTTKFTKITVEGYLPKDKTAFYFPVTLNSYLLPLRQITYCDTNNGTDSSFVQVTTKRAQEYVLVFGLFGRTDVQETDDKSEGVHPGSSADQIAEGFLVILFMILAQYSLLD